MFLAKDYDIMIDNLRNLNGRHLEKFWFLPANEIIEQERQSDWETRARSGSDKAYWAPDDYRDECIQREILRWQQERPS